MPKFKQPANRDREFKSKGQYRDRGKITQPTEKHVIDGEQDFLPGGLKGVLQPGPHNGGCYQSDRWSVNRPKRDYD